MSTKMVRIDFAESEHLVLRQVAARLGVPVRHYAHTALVRTATADLHAPDRRHGHEPPAGETLAGVPEARGDAPAAGPAPGPADAP